MSLYPVFSCVLDYGLTAYRKEDFEAISNGFNCGDVNRVYCAPEVLLGSSSNMTPAADVYRCVYVSLYKQLIKVFFRLSDLNHVVIWCNWIKDGGKTNIFVHLWFSVLSSATP